jgi:hypothetical protein
MAGEIIDTIALLVLAAALAGLGYFHWREAQAWRTERADLLNRLMARTYQEFVYSTPPDTTVATPPPPDISDQAWHEKNRDAHPDQYPDGLLGGDDT